MNRLFKVLVGILIIEILLGYFYYQKQYTKLTGNYISAVIMAAKSKTLRSFFSSKNKKDNVKEVEVNEVEANQDPKSNELNIEISEQENIFDCKEIENSSLMFHVSTMRVHRSPLKLQTSLKFQNTIDLKNKYLIAITGNSEALGIYHEKKIHTILEEKLNKKFKTDKIFVLNISNDGYLLKDQLISIESFSNIYPIDLALFYTGANELNRENYSNDLILDSDYIFNIQNKYWYEPPLGTLLYRNKNDYYKCLDENVFITKKNINEKNHFYAADINILRQYTKIKKKFNEKKLDYIFFIQPFNNQILSEINLSNALKEDYNLKKNWEKVKNISIPDEKFINLNNRKIDIDFADNFHSRDISEVSDIIYQTIIKLYGDKIKNQI